MAVPTWRWLVAGLVSLAAAGGVHAEFLPLAVDQGRCDCVVATPRASDQFYLIVGALAEAGRSTKVRVCTRAAAGPEALVLESAAPAQAWSRAIEAQARLLELERRRRPIFERFPPLACPPPAKTFHLFTGTHDLDDPASYQAVEAELCAVGRHAQVYLDHDDRGQPEVSKLIAEVIRVFDEETIPWADKNLGQVSDVDRDGRFTILVTRKLGAGRQGTAALDGCVRGSDFFIDLPAPFSNHCDMLYLNTKLTPGPHLQSILAHEYTHAVIFCEHALRSYNGTATSLDEEGWLNEGLAHIAENLHDYGWSNLDHRVSAFLSHPESYPLVVPDYFRAGLWRNPGTRGATFLFMRSVLTHTDTDLPRRLVQSPLRGVANLEAACQLPFGSMFRQAAVDLLARDNYGYLDGANKRPLLCGPRFREVPLDEGGAETAISGTAAAYFLLHSPARDFARVQIEVSGPAQVTLVRVPAGAPRLGLRWAGSPAMPRAELTAHHGRVTLIGAGWESGLVNMQESFDPVRWFSRDRLEDGGKLATAPLTVPGRAAGAEALFHVLAVDERGRPLAAWLAWPPAANLPN